MHKKFGDTLVEVALAIGIFSLVAIVIVSVISASTSGAQNAIEVTITREDLDSQAEALRFIHNAYLSERELAENKSNDSPLYREYAPLWQKLSRTDAKAKFSGLANFPDDISQFTSVDCREYYEKEEGDIHLISKDKAFVINTRNIDPKDVDSTIIPSQVNNALSNKFAATDLYPRIIFSTKDGKKNDDISLTEANINNFMIGDRPVYNKVARAEGIWVISARDYHLGGDKDDLNLPDPEFFDFHIRTCWFAPGHDRPSTIGTTIRLYNPEYIEGQQYGK